MRVDSIEIGYMSGNCLFGSCENVRHIKSLPFLSVVQPTLGYYEIGLDGAPPRPTPQGGAFIAPGNIRQEIIHHNGDGGIMTAQWVFLQITVNRLYAFEDVFDLPFILSPAECAPVTALLTAIREQKDLCERYACAYRIAGWLLARSTPKETGVGRTAAVLKRYIDRHYAESVRKEDLAGLICCSVPNLYRVFRQCFGMSPGRYIREFRLQKAALALENGTDPVTRIAGSVGFDDPAYFSKCFRDKYHVSPSEYRASLAVGPPAGTAGGAENLRNRG